MIYAFFKVGDNENYRDGMLIDVVDPSECGRGFKVKESNKVYAVVAFPDRAKGHLRNMLLPQYDGFDSQTGVPKIRISRVGCAKISDLCCNDTALEENLRAYGKDVPIIDGSKFSLENIIAPISSLSDSYVTDRNVIAGGTHNIGSGETYATAVLFLVDIGTLSSDAIGQYTSDVSEAATFELVKDLRGHDVHLTDATPHGGDVTKGRLISLNGEYWLRPIFGNGTFYFRNLKTKNVSGNVSIAPAGTNVTVIHDWFHDGNSRYDRAIVAFSNVYVYNSCFRNGSGSLGEVFETKGGTGHLFYNNLVHRYTRFSYIAAGSKVVFRNNGVFCNIQCFETGSNMTTSEGYNNAFSDTTGEDTDFGGGGSGNLTSLTLANEFYTDDTNGATYGRPKKTGSCYRNGHTTHKSTTDITARVWNAINPSIGAFQDDQLYYCDSAAVGANNGTSWTDAWTSLQSFFDTVIHYDTCYMRGTQTLTTSLTLTRYLGTYGFTNIIGCNASGVEDGTLATINANTAAANCILLNASVIIYYIFKNIHFTNPTSRCIYDAYNSGSHVYCYNCKFQNAVNQAVYVTGASRFIHCTFLNNVGIYVGNSDSIASLFEKCLAIHNSVSGNDLNAVNGYVLDCVFHGNSGATGAFLIGHYYRLSIVHNCTIDGYSQASLGYIIMRWSYNRFTNCTTGIGSAWKSGAGGSYNDNYFYNPTGTDIYGLLRSLDDTYNLITSENTKDGYKDRTSFDFSLKAGEAGVLVKKTVGAKDSGTYGYFTSGIPPLAQGGRQPRALIYGI